MNRASERELLAETSTSPTGELVILWGRRGVGKTALLERVLQDSNQRHLFYRATRRTLPLQLASLTEAAREAFPDRFLGQTFASTQTFLDFLAHLAREREPAGERVVVVIDELPYLAEEDPGFLTALQHWWDANKRCPVLKLYLAGSTLSFMERQVLDVAAPLYNRRTAAMRLEPMDYADAALFFPGYSPREKMETYAILGGMPSYLEQWDPAQSIRENLDRTVLKRNTYLSEEPDWLLLGELRSDVTYGSILRAVASGARKPSDIARAIGRDSAQDVAPRLATLQTLGLLERQVPVTERTAARSRNSLYWVADQYLEFWYRFVDPARSLVARGLGSQLWERAIQPALGDYVSRPCFERAARQYLWRALARGVVLPCEIHFVEIGSWWSGDSEIDVLALDEGGRVVLAGSCKWTNQPMEIRDYAALQSALQGSGLLMAPGGPHWALFSRAGFSERLRTVAEKRDETVILLIGLEELYQPDLTC